MGEVKTEVEGMAILVSFVQYTDDDGNLPPAELLH